MLNLFLLKILLSHPNPQTIAPNTYTRGP